jgi:hypothetical protein
MKHSLAPAATFFFAAVLLSCGGGQPVTHKGTFSNKTGQDAQDLHIVFDKEGVVYDAGESRTKLTSRAVNQNGKTTIDLDGSIPDASNALGQVFKRENGDFNVEKWWWTIKEGGQSVMIGVEHTGPPGNADQSGAWE